MSLKLETQVKLANKALRQAKAEAAKLLEKNTELEKKVAILESKLAEALKPRRRRKVVEENSDDNS